MELLPYQSVEERLEVRDPSQNGSNGDLFIDQYRVGREVKEVTTGPIVEMMSYRLNRNVVYSALPSVRNKEYIAVSQEELGGKKRGRSGGAQRKEVSLRGFEMDAQGIYRAQGPAPYRRFTSPVWARKLSS